MDAPRRASGRNWGCSERCAAPWCAARARLSVRDCGRRLRVRKKKNTVRDNTRGLCLLAPTARDGRFLFPMRGMVWCGMQQLGLTRSALERS